jgi:hypothetical protein
MAQDSVKRNGSRLQEYSLLIAHISRDAEELLFGNQHFLTPSSTDGPRSREITPFAQRIIASGA